MLSDSLMPSVDLLVAKRWPDFANPQASQRWGWHDDHRANDKTPDYLPAIQQVRAEFAGLLQSMLTAPNVRDVLDGKALQLGFGSCRASHEVWDGLFFRGAVTLDYQVCADGPIDHRGGDIHSADVMAFAESRGPYRFLFCDAGHTFDAVKADYEAYEGMVVAGGVIAFHDTLPRKGYEEVEVWRFLQTIEALGRRVHRIGSEVGAAWIVKA